MTAMRTAVIQTTEKMVLRMTAVGQKWALQNQSKAAPISFIRILTVSSQLVFRWKSSPVSSLN
jgi:hypothetical protein